MIDTEDREELLICDNCGAMSETIVHDELLKKWLCPDCFKELNRQWEEGYFDDE